MSAVMVWLLPMNVPWNELSALVPAVFVTVMSAVNCTYLPLHVSVPSLTLVAKVSHSPALLMM